MISSGEKVSQNEPRMRKQNYFSRGHYQARVTADLGFYDLRLPEARKAQAEPAKRHGIEGFYYYHYWFNGKMLLERPFNEVFKSSSPSQHLDQLLFAKARQKGKSGSLGILLSKRYWKSENTALSPAQSSTRKNLTRRAGKTSAAWFYVPKARIFWEEKWNYPAVQEDVQPE